jgi:hypothetical protein
MSHCADEAKSRQGSIAIDAPMTQLSADNSAMHERREERL